MVVHRTGTVVTLRHQTTFAVIMVSPLGVTVTASSSAWGCFITICDSMVQPQMDWDQFRNISHLDLVELKQIRDSIYACIILLFANCNFRERGVHSLTHYFIECKCVFAE